MKPASGNGLRSFHVSRFCETLLIRFAGITLLGNGAVLPGSRIARVVPGVVSRGTSDSRAGAFGEIADRMAKVGTDASAGVLRRSSRASQLNSQNVLSRTTGPESTVPYWFRRSLFFR